LPSRPPARATARDRPQRRERKGQGDRKGSPQRRERKGQGDRLTFSHNFNRVPTRPVARPKKHVGLSRQLFGMYSSSSFSTSISRYFTRYTKIVANSQAVALFPPSRPVDISTPEPILAR